MHHCHYQHRRFHSSPWQRISFDPPKQTHDTMETKPPLDTTTIITTTTVACESTRARQTIARQPSSCNSPMSMMHEGDERQCDDGWTMRRGNIALITLVHHRHCCLIVIGLLVSVALGVGNRYLTMHVIVVGGGVFGITAAISLAGRGHRVDVYDAGSFPASHVSARCHTPNTCACHSPCKDYQYTGLALLIRLIVSHAHM
jgi:hypothetical protein